MNEKVKQVIVIRKDLKVRKGKYCSQAGHSAMSFLTKRLVLVDELCVKFNTPENEQGFEYRILLSKEEKTWIEGKFTKITCQVKDEQELLNVYEKAKQVGLEVNLITDAGLTEFKNIPTNTCIAIGPHIESKFVGITDHLELF